MECFSSLDQNHLMSQALHIVSINGALAKALSTHDLSQLYQACRAGREEAPTALKHLIVYLPGSKEAGDQRDLTPQQLAALHSKSCQPELSLTLRCSSYNASVDQYIRQYIASVSPMMLKRIMKICLCVSATVSDVLDHTADSRTWRLLPVCAPFMPNVHLLTIDMGIVDCFGTFCNTSPRVEDMANICEALSSLPKLQTLRLGGTIVPAQLADALGSAKNLRRVDLCLSTRPKLPRFGGLLDLAMAPVAQRLEELGIFHPVNDFGTRDFGTRYRFPRVRILRCMDDVPAVEVANIFPALTHVKGGGRLIVRAHDCLSLLAGSRAVARMFNRCGRLACPCRAQVAERLGEVVFELQPESSWERFLIGHGQAPLAPMHGVRAVCLQPPGAIACLGACNGGREIATCLHQLSQIARLLPDLESLTVHFDGLPDENKRSVQLGRFLHHVALAFKRPILLRLNREPVCKSTKLDVDRLTGIITDVVGGSTDVRNAVQVAGIISGILSGQITV